MRHDYADCSFCGGRVTEKKVRVDYRLGDELIIFEDVPAGVCSQCGERYYTAKVAKAMERMSTDPDKGTASRTIQVPVKSFSEKMVI